MGNIEFAVVGIGLNLFEASEGYPDALQGIAGGIYESREAAAELDRSRLAAEIVNTLLEETRNYGFRLNIYSIILCPEGKYGFRTEEIRAGESTGNLSGWKAQSTGSRRLIFGLILWRNINYNMKLYLI